MNEQQRITFLKAALVRAIADSCGGCGRDSCLPCQTLEMLYGE